jgi:hypothetical protein
MARMAATRGRDYLIGMTPDLVLIPKLIAADRIVRDGRRIVNFAPESS